MNTFITKVIPTLVFIIISTISLFLTACGGGGGNIKTTASGVSSGGSDNAPVISGTPLSSVSVNSLYTFIPDAYDPDGDTIAFTITNKPSWAVFDEVNGSLSGRPAAADVGTARGIVISASDGRLTTSLTAFNIVVTDIASASSIYVDLTLLSDCSTYDVTTRSCQAGGAANAYHQMETALLAATPGTTVVLRGGSYGQISPPKSGLDGSPITIMGYPGEIAQIVNLPGKVALWVVDRTDLVFDNLTIKNVQGFARIQDSLRITIKNSVFDTSISTGTTSAIKFVRSTFNRLLNNVIDNGGGDSLLLQDSSNKNLISGNTFYSAHHSNFSIRCANYNVIRDNTFANPLEKIGEIFDCEGVSDAPVLYDATKHNVIENNLFYITKATSADYRYNAIQHGGQHTIVRRNVFRNNDGGGVNYQQYPDESMYVYGNRLYNNTFYNNRCYAIIGNNPGDASIYYDNVVKNNLLYKNSDCAGGGGQIKVQGPEYVILVGNVIASADPLFVDEEKFDLHLKPSSPHIDSGVYLAKVVGNGSGTVLQLDDAGYFFDGYGIPGEVGDEIQLENQSQSATITSVDYLNNVISVDKVLSWEDGQGIALRYNGTAPDVGAFEME